MQVRCWIACCLLNTVNSSVSALNVSHSFTSCKDYSSIMMDYEKWKHKIVCIGNICLYACSILCMPKASYTLPDIWADFAVADHFWRSPTNPPRSDAPRRRLWSLCVKCIATFLATIIVIGDASPSMYEGLPFLITLPPAPAWLLINPTRARGGEQVSSTSNCNWPIKHYY